MAAARASSLFCLRADFAFSCFSISFVPRDACEISPSGLPSWREYGSRMNAVQHRICSQPRIMMSKTRWRPPTPGPSSSHVFGWSTTHDHSWVITITDLTMPLMHCVPFNARMKRMSWNSSKSGSRKARIVVK